MISSVLGVVWYRFRATLGRHRGGYLSLVLLIGLVGGVAIGSAAAARRTQSSFSVFLSSTNPSDLSVPIYPAGAIGTSGPSYSARLTNQIAGLPGVKHVEAWVDVNAAPLRPGPPPWVTWPRSTRPPASTAFTSNRTGRRSSRAGWPIPVAPMSS